MTRSNTIELADLFINNRFVLAWDHKPQIAEIDFSLVLCFERFFRKNQQIFPLLLVKYLSFREGCDGKRNSKALCAAPPGRSSSLILERGTAILAPHTNHRNMLPTDNFLRSLLFSPYWEQLKCRKISKILPNH